MYMQSSSWWNTTQDRCISSYKIAQKADLYHCILACGHYEAANSIPVRCPNVPQSQSLIMHSKRMVVNWLCNQISSCLTMSGFNRRAFNIPHIYKMARLEHETYLLKYPVHSVLGSRCQISYSNIRHIFSQRVDRL